MVSVKHLPVHMQLSTQKINDEFNRIHINLLCSKTRVAPIYQLTIPKLELNAAVLLTKLFEKTIKAFKRDDIKSYARSDSTISLFWIRNSTTKLPPFVASRVSEICKAKLIWRHVPTELNPADCASRRLTPSQLINHDLWWHGPTFLCGTEDNWPIDIINTQATAPMEAVEVSTFTIIISECNVLPLKKYSSFQRLQRIVAYCYPFAHNCWGKTKISTPLTARELQAATIAIVQEVQREAYPNEFSMLSNNEAVRKGNLAPLNPFLDDNRVIRLNGRLEKSNLPYHEKHPMILPKNHHDDMSWLFNAHISLPAKLVLGSKRNQHHKESRTFLPKVRQI